MDDFFPSQPCFHTMNALAPLAVARRLSAALCKTNVCPVIVCVGSDHVAGDSLGPLTGSLLLQGQDAPARSRHRRGRRRWEPRGDGAHQSLLISAIPRLRCKEAARQHRGCEPSRHRGGERGRLSRPRTRALFRRLCDGVRVERGAPSRLGATRPSLCFLICEERPLSYAYKAK